MEIEVAITIRKNGQYSTERIAQSESKRIVVCDDNDYRRAGQSARMLAEDTMNDVATQLQALTRRAAEAQDDER